MTLRDAEQFARSRLRDAAIDSYAAEASLLLQYLCGLSRSDLALQLDRQLSPAQQTTLLEWLERRAGREPLQHIVGFANFYGLEFSVSPAVLIPRPETEVLVERALTLLKGVPNPRILDIGTGSGAIALAIRQERPDATVMATDISEAALSVAQDNAARLHLDIQLVQSDLLSSVKVADFARTADLITANLPYLPESDQGTLSPEVAYDPALALYSGEDGLAAFWRCEAQLKALVNPGTICLFELDPRNIMLASQQSGWQHIERISDLLGRERFLWLQR
jgi:release factor glutamine methyltransferase